MPGGNPLPLVMDLRAGTKCKWFRTWCSSCEEWQLLPSRGGKGGPGQYGCKRAPSFPRTTRHARLRGRPFTICGLWAISTWITLMPCDLTCWAISLKLEEDPELWQ
ncbi:uncharacterized protein LOC135319165 isoform X1 [Camelus dromedarius]|uniref:uncharacterized protein LOC135319165 isoform X1 n=1 Tax=Camelus dromedarius TaxID=9838 RepID=UPI00311A7C88